MDGRQVQPATVNWLIVVVVVVMVLSFNQIGLDGRTGAILGVILGLIGGAVGTAVTIRQARSPQERAFWLRTSAVLILLTVSFIVAFVLVPGWYRFLLFIPFGIALALLMRKSRLSEFSGRPPTSIILPGGANAGASDRNPDR
jgi:hypothetical protein